MTLDPLPQDLLELDTLRANTVFSDRNANAMGKFVTKLRSIAPRYEYSNNALHLTVLTKCWTQYLRYLVGYSSTPKLHLHDIDQGIRYLTKKKQIAALMTDNENSGLLALLVMTRVQFASVGCAHPKHLHIGRLFEQWSGVAVSSATIHSLEKTVDLLYGPGAWLLYHDEASREEALPKYLWQKMLPLRVDTPAGSPARPSLELPFDLS